MLTMREQYYGCILCNTEVCRESTDPNMQMCVGVVTGKTMEQSFGVRVVCGTVLFRKERWL